MAISDLESSGGGGVFLFAGVRCCGRLPFGGYTAGVVVVLAKVWLGRKIRSFFISSSITACGTFQSCIFGRISSIRPFWSPW
jgi:hypothetical protein